MVEPVEPPAPIWDRIKGNLPGVEHDAEADMPAAPVPAALAPEPERSPPPSDTIATLEALEAELREEGLAPPEAPAIDAPAPAIDSPMPAIEPPTPAIEPPTPAIEPRPLASTRELDWEPAADRQERTVPPVPHTPPARSGRLFATLMTVVAIALAGLIAAWRYIPDLLPSQLRAEQVLNIHLPGPPPAPARPPAPPESQFDE
jgi:hypothetical protein